MAKANDFKKFDFNKPRHQIFVFPEKQDIARESAHKKASITTKRYWANRRIEERDRQSFMGLGKGD